MTAQGADVLLISLTELGRRIFDAAACSLAVLEPDEEHLLFRAATGAGADEVRGMRLPVGRGIAGWVVASGQPIAVHDVRADPRFALDVAESTGYVPRSILAAPVLGSAEAVGVMEVLDRAEPPRPHDMEVLTLLARQAGLALELAEPAAQIPGPAADPAALMAAVARLDATEQQAAAALLGAFLDYLGRRGGPAGLV